MRQPHSLPSLSSTKPRSLQQFFTLGFSIVFLVSLFCFLSAPAYGAQKHGCAPDTPPPVPGATPAPGIPGSIRINEVLSQPGTGWNCSDPPNVFSQQTDAWIELYNTQSSPLNLYAAHAELSFDNGTTWHYLAFGSAIAANKFLVVFPEENTQTPDSAWTTITLAMNSTIIDQATIPQLQPDQSYARVPDGANTWQLVGHPTIDASNNTSGQPITPTPTRTPKATKTPGGKTGSNKSGGANTNAPISTGTQPAWNKVQVPSNPEAPVTTPAANTTTRLLYQPQVTSATTGNAQTDWWHNLLLSVFLLLLVGALLWCWRLFRTP